MPSIDFDQILINLDGTPIFDDARPPKPATLAVTCVKALTLTLVGESVDGAEKFRRYQLAARIAGGGECALSVEEVVKLKDVTGRAYPPSVVGPVWLMLDPPMTPPEA